MIRASLVLLLAIATVAISACGADQAPTAPDNPAAYVATTIVERAAGYESVRSYSGRIEARLDSALGFELSGLVIDVAVNEGDTVNQGDVIARLDSSRLLARRAEAQASLDRIAAELALANSTLQRVADAYAYKGVSQQQLDEAQQRVSSLSASRTVASANVDRIDIDIRKSTLTAAFDGSVAGRFVDPGTVVAAGTPLVRLLSDSNLEARIGLAPLAAETFAPGDRVELSIDGRPVSARLQAIISARNEQTRTVDAIFALIEPPATVRSGDTASIETRVWNDAAGFRVPLAALVDGPRGLWQILVAEPGNNDEHQLQAHIVEVLHADSETAFVRGTLKNGDRIVSGGTQRVVAGQRVRVDKNTRAAQLSAAGDSSGN